MPLLWTGSYSLFAYLIPIILLSASTSSSLMKYFYQPKNAIFAIFEKNSSCSFFSAIDSLLCSLLQENSYRELSRLIALTSSFPPLFYTIPVRLVSPALHWNLSWLLPIAVLPNLWSVLSPYFVSQKLLIHLAIFIFLPATLFSWFLGQKFPWIPFLFLAAQFQSPVLVLSTLPNL